MIRPKDGGQVHKKYGGQVGKTISHYPAFRDPVRRDKILEKLGPKTVERSVKMIAVYWTKKMN